MLLLLLFVAVCGGRLQLAGKSSDNDDDRPSTQAPIQSRSGARTHTHTPHIQRLGYLAFLFIILIGFGYTRKYVLIYNWRMGSTIILCDITLRFAKIFWFASLLNALIEDETTRVGSMTAN